MPVMSVESASVKNWQILCVLWMLKVAIGNFRILSDRHYNYFSDATTATALPVEEGE